MNKATLGKQLADKRKAKGLSVYRVSKDSNLTRPQVDSIEKATANYTIETLIEYCNTCDIKLIVTA